MKPLVDYYSILKGLKEKISRAKMQAALSVNHLVLTTYWEIGKTINEQEIAGGWGSKIVEKLAADLKLEFPDMTGLSARNLRYMRDFALAYPEFSILQPAVAKLENDNNEVPLVFLQPAVAKIPWTHHTIILTKVKSREERLFYIAKTVENEWSKSILTLQIESDLYKRQGKAITNFSATLPAIQSDLAQETFKSPYIFEFLNLGEKVKETELEKALIKHLKDFMLELGKGFAYVGNQFNLNVAGDDFFLDLLFFNFHLNCFVVFELKIADFKPEFAGKLNFYINTIDAQIKGKVHNPTIGVLLCKTPNETVVKYSLQSIDTPMGVANYTLADVLPKELTSEFPTVEELGAEVEKEIEKLHKPIDKKLDRLKELLSGLKTEELKETINAANTLRVWHKVIVPLKNKIQEALNDLAQEFSKMEMILWINVHGYRTEEDALHQLTSSTGLTSDFKIEAKLFSLKKAGKMTFDIGVEVQIRMETVLYYCIISHKRQERTWEKMYHQLPSEEELDLTTERVHEIVTESIVEELERIKNK